MDTTKKNLWNLSICAKPRPTLAGGTAVFRNSVPPPIISTQSTLAILYEDDWGTRSRRMENAFSLKTNVEKLKSF